jgi:hypothetical protein
MIVEKEELEIEELEEIERDGRAVLSEKLQKFF